MKDSKKRFSNRVDDYKKYRPSYPAQIISYLTDKCDLTSSSTIADIGSGTGIFTKLLLKGGFTVKAIEPNESMRRQAESDLSSFNNFESINGSAENTTLETDSVDLITSCQAFHWFDHDKCKVELRRILRKDGCVALIWNERLADTPFMRGYENLLTELEDRRMVDQATISAFYAPNKYGVVKFPNKQTFDLTGIKGRFLSSSYAPKEGEKGHTEALEMLESLFKKHNENGHVDFNYSTVVYLGVLK